MNYRHNSAWRNNQERAIKTTISVLENFGVGETKNIPSIVAPELSDKSSGFRRFQDVLYDEALFDAELSFAAEVAGNTKDVYHDHPRLKVHMEANLHRFADALYAAELYCRMSNKYGHEFAVGIHDKVNSSFAHISFLSEFYETVMFRTRVCLLQKEKTGIRNFRLK